MRSRLRKIFSFLFRVDPQERLKLFFLTASFFLIVGGYTLIKELKDSIFLSIVGEDYQPWAKIISMIVLVPSIIFYSFLVDKMRRYHLLCFYSIAYSLLGLIFVYFLGHPTIGISNTDTSPYRIFGWLFYFFVEGYSPFVLSVFWAFANSITNPEAAKKNYGLMVSGSKLGGMLTSGFALYFFSCTNKNVILLSPVVKHQILLLVPSLFLLFVPVFILLLMKKVPGHYLHGYEAVYKIEKEKSKEKEKINLFSGLMFILRQPYVLGIYSMIFFYEVIYAILSYQRLLLAKGAAKDISDLSFALFKQIFATHLFGFFLSFFATNALLRKFGEKKCLLLVPVVTGILLFMFMLHHTFDTLILICICLRAVNYALNYPLRESLYIPTIKEIKFKSKSWVDTFGTKFAKGFGSSFNIFAKIILNDFGVSAFLGFHTIFFAILTGTWFFAANLLGNRYQKAISKNEVIGATQ